MQAGCKPDASNPTPNGLPNALLLAWPAVPEHIRLVILALVAPYAGGGNAEQERTQVRAQLGGSRTLNENQSQTESLLDIVKAIKAQTLLLPGFQRDFRWEMDQTYDLFDSLIREIFIGTIIHGKPSFEMLLREIDGRPRKGPGSRPGTSHRGGRHGRPPHFVANPAPAKRSCQ